MSERFVDKYRPQRLEEIVGQSRVVTQLTGLIQEGKIAGNTILISGPYGTGKTSIGRVLARVVNCKEGGTEPCGACKSCLLSLDHHPDIQEINAADTRGIDDVRKILDTVRLHPRFKVRVFILDELHQLTGPAAQAFLKTLEEPPKHTLFVLCTTEPYKLLDTIRSRSTWLKLAEIGSRDMSRLLGRICKQESFSISKEVLAYISELSGGHGRDAVNLLEQLGAAASGMSLEEAQEQLPALAEGILGASPAVLVPKYVHRLLDGTIVPMVHLRKVDNLDYFIGLVLKFLKEYLILQIEPKMIEDKAMISFASSTKFKKAPTVAQLTSIFEIHLEAQERVKSRGVDPLDAMDLAILKSFQVLGK